MERSDRPPGDRNTGYCGPFLGILPVGAGSPGKTGSRKAGIAFQNARSFLPSGKNLFSLRVSVIC